MGGATEEIVAEIGNDLSRMLRILEITRECGFKTEEERLIAALRHAGRSLDVLLGVGDRETRRRIGEMLAQIDTAVAPKA